ncbi:hypothetical protein QBC35DRAFT_504068 [Podospora australis]|uniref:Rhodopsin domain-containing protein n=1 Tax=Podospora australis TaxID=1536484 RepID=A0AAN7AFD9_9PEZI|nr:hypothetical protein QBC35DRAFT_504068 [Podospora australis]
MSAATPPPPPSTTEGGFLAAGITLCVFTGIIVTVRLIANWHTASKLNADDYLSVIATTFLAANFAVFFVLFRAQNEGFFNDPDPRPAIRRVAQYAEANIFLSGFSMWTAKLPVLVLLARIFGVYRGVRIVSIITMVVLGMAILGADIYNAIPCRPPAADAPLLEIMGFVEKCTDASSLTGVIIAPIGLVADIIIFLLPLPVIIGLQLSLDKKIGLVVVFLFGLVAIAVTAVSMKFKFDSRSGVTTDVQLAMILTLVETTIVIAAGCVPSVKAFWVSFIVKSGWYSRLSSLLSSRRGITTDKATKGSGSHQTIGSGGSQNINQYYQLEDQHHSTRKLTEDPYVRPIDDLETRR